MGSFRFVYRPLVALLLLPAAFSQDRTPRFADYPASGHATGKSAPVKLHTKEDREYRTRLRAAALQAPNFAGHYVLSAWGCGAECLMGAVIDAATGEVYWLPHTICCWDADVDQPIQFRLASSLIIFIGARNEQDGDNGRHYYQFKDGKLLHLQSVKKKSK